MTGGNNENNEKKLLVIHEFGKKKTMIKILEKRFIWLEEFILY